MCRLSWNLGTSTSWSSRGLPRPVMGLLFTLSINPWCSCDVCLQFHVVGRHAPTSEVRQECAAFVITTGFIILLFYTVCDRANGSGNWVHSIYISPWTSRCVCTCSTMVIYVIDTTNCIVLYCTVLYCIVLYCTVLYCDVLYCIVLYCIVLTVLYCIALYCIVLCCIVLCCIVLCCIVLYCVVLCCIVLYCIVLYCIVLYCIVLCREMWLHVTSLDLILNFKIISKQL
jgi:hypothetical protein